MNPYNYNGDNAIQPFTMWSLEFFIGKMDSKSRWYTLNWFIKTEWRRHFTPLCLIALRYAWWSGLESLSGRIWPLIFLWSFLLAVKLSVLSSEASKVTEGLLGFYTSNIVVLTVFGSFLSVRWPLGARGGMETSVEGVLSGKNYCWCRKQIWISSCAPQIALWLFD